MLLKIWRDFFELLLALRRDLYRGEEKRLWVNAMVWKELELYFLCFIFPSWRQKKTRPRRNNYAGLCWLHIKKKPRVHEYIVKVIHILAGYLYKIAPRDPFQPYILQILKWDRVSLREGNGKNMGLGVHMERKL